MTSQEIFIANARKLMHPSVVELHKRCLGIKEQDLECCHDWLDHWGKTVIDGVICFVSEPYSVDDRKVNSAAAWAKKMSLDFYVSSNSYWFPGQTIRFVFRRKEPA